MGNGRVIQAGELQYMAAGTGVQHSEFNPSKDEAVRLLQIWIQPDAKGVKPRYAGEVVQARCAAGQLQSGRRARPDAMVRSRSIRTPTLSLAKLDAGQTGRRTN